MAIVVASGALGGAVLVFSGGSGESIGTTVAASTPAPILMYHAISEVPSDAPYPELYVSPHDFAAEMSWLDGEGFDAVTLDQLRSAWEGKATIPPKPVVISFDDGLQTQFTEALPVLREMGWPGVLNLKVESLEQGELTEAMVRRMIEAGWEIDSHTITHADVTELDGEALNREVAGSRRILQRRFDVPVNFFCYPAGHFNPATIAAVRDAGYVGATTTKPGLAEPDADPFRLSRVRVEGMGGVAGLDEELSELAVGDPG